MDPDAVLALVRHRHPEAVCWYGDFTGRYWFLSPHQTLVEADDANALVRQLGVCYPPSARAPRSGDGPRQRRTVRMQRASRSVEGVAAAVRMAEPVLPERKGLLRRVVGWVTGRRAASAAQCGDVCCAPERGERVNLWEASC
ncbi:hypothetical protein AB0L06_00655 [Spirillospora sp. NPDC052269]